MNHYIIRTIIITLFLTHAGINSVLAQAQPARPPGFAAGGPEQIEQFFRILQWGAISQILTVVVLLVCLGTILPRLRRIEEALQKATEKK